MKIIIFGATGRTGRLLVQQALDSGHEVTAAARRPEAIQAHGPRLTKLRCDLFDAPATLEAVAGHECILSAIGASEPFGPTTVFSTGIKNILAGARKARVRRIIVLSSAAVDGHVILPLHIKLFANLIIKPLLFGLYVDSARMEEILETADCDWTIMHPPRLTNGRQTTDYRMAAGQHLANLTSLSRADLADCVLKLIADPSSYRTWVEVTGNASF